MAVYFDLKTNGIWSQSNIPGFHDEHFEVDEVIAPIIQELNRKGYKTRFCCSGHPYVSMEEAFVTSEETAWATFPFTEHVEKVNNPEDLDFPYRACFRAPETNLYIFFEENLEAELTVPLPGGFWWDEGDGRVLRYDYSKFFFPDEEAFEFFEERLKACRALYEWAKRLPPYKQRGALNDSSVSASAG